MSAQVRAVATFLAILGLLASPARASGEGSLRVGASGDYAPFSLRTEAGLEGFSQTVAEAYAAQTGRPLESVPFRWPELLAALLAALDERLALMPLVAQVKRARGLPVEVPERETRVLDAAVAAVGEAAAAARAGLPARPPRDAGRAARTLPGRRRRAGPCRRHRRRGGRGVPGGVSAQ